MTKTVLGIDGSTNSYAYGVIKDGKLTDYGELLFDGNTIMERLGSARASADKLCRRKIDKVYVEETVFMNNRQVVIKLSQFAGVIYSAVVHKEIPLATVVPIHWQKYIGNDPFDAKEKAALKKEFPKKSKSWYSNKRRERRKERTMDYVRERFGVDVDNDNIADAIAIAAFGYDRETQ